MSEPNSIHLRAMEPGDLPHAYDLSQAVGWGHRLEDWTMLFHLGKGIVAVNSQRAIQGVGLWWPYGATFATLGMVIVSPKLQRSGIGRRLVEGILAATDGRRVLLNATTAGLGLYESFGFVVTDRICTHFGTLSPNASPCNGEIQVRELQVQDWPAVGVLDQQASSMDRSSLLAALRGESRGWVSESAGQLNGFVLCRQFGRGTVIGPLVAATEVAALALLSTAAVRIGGVLRADIPADAADLSRWLQTEGLVRTGQVSTMWRPGPPVSDRRVRVFGLAAQALG